jgi:hypothetical protein
MDEMKVYIVKLIGKDAVAHCICIAVNPEIAREKAIRKAPWFKDVEWVREVPQHAQQCYAVLL